MTERIQISEIFDVSYGSFKTPINKLEQGKTPLISSGSVNNGVVGFFNIEPLYKDVISVARTGSVGEAFLHTYDCVINSDCMVLTPKVSLTQKEMYWYVLFLRKLKNRFCYARKVTPSRLGQIFIPKEIPDWVQHLDLNLENSLSMSSTQKKINLKDREWEWFQYDELFDVKKGKRVVNGDLKAGKTPLIRPIDSNNGLVGFVELEPNFEANVITVNYNGNGVAEAYYQPNPFFAVDDVQVLYTKFTFTPEIAMFLATLIRKEKYRFNYGRKWHLERMRKSKIKLPVNERRQPDWNFMQEYIKSLPYSASL